MGFNYSKLRGRIVEYYKTTEAFADALGISRSSLSQKLNNRVGWYSTEITKSAELLHFSNMEIGAYFFTE